MKNKILLLAASALTVMTLAGCGQRQTEDTTPPASNTAGEQPAPSAAATNNAVTPPAPNPGDATTPALTNSPGTNNPPATSP